MWKSFKTFEQKRFKKIKCFNEQIYCDKTASYLMIETKRNQMLFLLEVFFKCFMPLDCITKKFLKTPLDICCYLL